MHPSLVCGSPTKLGYGIKRMAYAKYERAIMKKNEDARANCAGLINLLNTNMTVFRFFFRFNIEF